MLEENLYGLKEIHSELLNLFSAFDDLCRQHNIAYSAMYGTMLGAVREKGFIPWDDDVDLLMDVESYSLLFEKLKEDKEYFIDTYDAWVPRFRRRDQPKGVFIDIFLMTDMPAGIRKTITIYRLRALQGMLKKYKSKHASFGYKIILAGTKAIGKLFPRKVLLNRYQKIAYGKKYDSGMVYLPNSGFESMAVGLDKEKMKAGYIEFPFENMKIPVCKEYDYILTRFFGPDYMTPVKESERKPFHSEQIQE